jgi:hypothetical protein
MSEYLSFDLWSEDDYDVEPGTGCWLWHGPYHAMGTGYSGALHAVVRGSRHMRAVRQIYEDILGEPLPADLDVRATCRTNTDSCVVKRCVNPDHHVLYLLPNGARKESRP